MSLPALNADFVDLLLALQKAQVDFMIVGAHALAAHGVPRATGDLDVLVRPEQENAARVVAALTDFGAPLAAHGLGVQDFVTPGTVYQLGLPPRRIDVLTRISGVSFEDVVLPGRRLAGRPPGSGPWTGGAPAQQARRRAGQGSAGCRVARAPEALKRVVPPSTGSPAA